MAKTEDFASFGVTEDTNSIFAPVRHLSVVAALAQRPFLKSGKREKPKWQNSTSERELKLER